MSAHTKAAENAAPEALLPISAPTTGEAQLRLADGPIGVFDSGLGGLSVLRHLLVALPEERFVYIADSGRAPYGKRPTEEVVAFSEQIVDRLVRVYGCKLIVVACNTATAAAAKTLREQHPKLPIIGMEPAVKPAAAATRSGKVGVMATAGTIASAKYAALLREHGAGLSLTEDPCVGLVALIEAGHLDDELLLQRLREIIEPMRKVGIDTIVLGCTHFPLVEAEIRQIAGSAITVIDPAPAVVRQVGRVLRERELAKIEDEGGLEGLHEVPPLLLITTGEVEAFRQNAIRLLLGVDFVVERWVCPGV